MFDKEKKPKKKFQRLKKFLYYSNTKNLIGEIETYGYHCSWQKLFITYAIAVAAAVAVGILYQMSYLSIAILIVYVLACMPSILITNYKSLYQQKRFSDANKYIEKMLYYFRVKPKITDCLQDAIKAFKNEVVMRELLESVLKKIVEESDSETAKEEALEMINKEYNCRRIQVVNSFMLSIERNGGEYSRSLRLLLDDRSMWAERTMKMQQQKKFIRQQIIIAIVLVTALCLIVVHFPDIVSKSIKMDPVGQTFLVQAFDLIYLILQLRIFMKADKKMCIDWLDENTGISDNEANRLFSKIMNYDMDKEKRDSAIYTAITVAVTGVLYFLFKSKFILLLGVAATIFMVQQHNVDYNLAKKALRKQVQLVFPVWMMDVALLLQSENVRMAIRHSYNNAPKILKPPLYQMLNDLANNPDSPEPYDRFLEELNIPEVQDAMSTLYSVSAGLGGNVSEEFESIIQKTNALRDNAESIKNNDKLAVFKAYMSLPGIVGSLDMLVVMAALIQSFMTIDINI